jgi:flavodoxin
MAKASIIYESKYGNTKRVAEIIAEGIKQTSAIDTIIAELKSVDPAKVVGFEAILIGSPNHMGRATRDIRKFIDKLGTLNLDGKHVAVFDTYMGRDFEKAVKGMEKQLREKVAGLKLLTPGLSIKVNEMEGPIADGELPKCKEFGAKIATLPKG